MFDPLSEGIDELLLARLELGKIEVPCENVSEMTQLRQKIYSRGLAIRKYCEKTKQLGQLYNAASTFTVLMDKNRNMLTISDRDGIVGVRAVKNALARLNYSKIESDINTDDIGVDKSKPNASELLKELESDIVNTPTPNPFYSRD